MIGVKTALTFAAPLAAMMLAAVPAHAARVESGGAACALARGRVAARLHRSLSSIPGCETIRAGDSPRGFYVLALRGRCREQICGSTLIGWFAVQKSTGRLFVWEVGEWRLGTPIGHRP